MGDELGYSEADYPGQVVEMIDALDLREYVVWLGHIDNVASAYKAFDLTLMPSEYEGLPNVCIESLICHPGYRF